jgi:hypothetical protein
MKGWPIIFVALALVCVGQMRVGAQEPRMAEPAWSVGDMWTYSVEASGKREIMTIVVVAVRDKDYTIRTIQADGHYELSSAPRESTPVGNLGGVGEISWPLSVGQHWSGTDSSTHSKIEATVDAFELVVVPAGTLGAFRIAVRICADALQGACGSMRFWIAPQVKTVVKLEFGREPAIPENARGATIILVAYAVAP